MSLAPEVAEFRRRCLADSGFVCRHLLGWNYDEDDFQRRTNVGTGGVRASGAHQQMVEVLDDPTTKYKLIEAPRGSYKSTILQGYVVRQILLNPDIRVYYVCATSDLAIEKATAIKKALTLPLVEEHFGSQVGEPWAVQRFTVRGRKQRNLQTTTFSVWSQENLPTGGRANIIVLDDFIDRRNCTNKEQIKKSKEMYRLVAPFLAKGGTLIVVGTRWAEGDLYEDLERNELFRHPYGRQLVIGAGVHVVQEEGGRLGLAEDRVGITFPHMDMDFLQRKLHGMSLKGEFVEFSCQYLNVVPAGAGSLFRRHFFQPLAWGEDMQNLSGYLLTDTAISQKDEGCYSVLAYVGLDASDNVYLLDLRVGHFDTGEFVNHFFSVLEEWRPKVNHCGEVWEDVALATAYNYAITTDQRARKQRLNAISIKRYSSEGKLMRIQRMHAPMYQKMFWVVNTVPKYFDDYDGEKLLWDPEGYIDPRTKVLQPDGELVTEFLSFRKAEQKVDIPDTIAMVLEYENHRGRLRRYCPYKPPRQRLPQPSLTDQRRQLYRAESISNDRDWWDRTLDDVYGQR